MCKTCLKARNRAAYLSKRDSRIEYAKDYYKEHKEHKKTYQREYYTATAEYQKEWQKKYKKDHRYKYNSYEGKRRAAKLSATPTWLTANQIEHMKYVYWLAKDLSYLTGEVYQVDHIVPLQGRNVCGLHVPWNLQILTAEENARKKNKL